MPDHDPPNAVATAGAERVTAHLREIGLTPTRVLESAEGGIGICFIDGDKYADIECLNTGEVLAVTSNRRDLPFVWEVGPDGIAQAVAKIRAFLAPAA